MYLESARKQCLVFEGLAELGHDFCDGQFFLLFTLDVQLDFSLVKHDHAVAVF
jgi:hypothetical protein